MQAARLLLKQLPNPCESISLPSLYVTAAILVKNDNNYKAVELIIKEINPNIVKQLSNEIKSSLLDEAVYFGAIKIARLLLENGAKEIINNIDTEGNTAIVKAITVNNLPTVQLLLEYKPNLHIKSTGALSLVQRAMVHKNDDIKLALIKAGAPKLEGGALRKFKEAIDKGDIQVSQANLPDAEFKEYEKLYYAGVANYCKGLYSDKNSANYFKEAIIKTKKSIELELKAGTLTDTKLKTLLELSTVLKFDKSKELYEFIIDIAVRWKLAYIACPIYNILCVENISKGDSFTALKYAELALEQLQMIFNKEIPLELPKHLINELSHNSFYNHAKALLSINRQKALVSFIKAKNYSQKDQNTIAEITQIYFALGEKEKAIEASEQILDTNYRDLILINSLIECEPLSAEDITILLNKYDFFGRFGNGEKLRTPDLREHYNLYYNIRLKKLILNKEYREAIEHADNFISYLNENYLIENNVQITPYIARLLEIYQTCGNWEKGGEHLEQLYLKFPDILSNHSFLPLKYYEFLIFYSTGKTKEAEKILEFLNSKADLGSLAKTLSTKANTVCFFGETENNNFDKAKEYLPLLGDGINQERMLSLIEKAQSFQQMQVEISPQDTAEKKVKQATIKLTNEELLTFDLVAENIEELENSNLDFTPQLIHQYFQQKKQTLLKKKPDNNEPGKELICWGYRGKIYSTKNKDLYKIEGKADFYGIIDHKLAEKLDHALQEQYTTALAKGLVSKTHNSVGVKFIPGKLIELKINADLRLYATEVYENAEGKYLIVFDKEGNHEKIAKVANSGNLKVLNSDENHITNIIEDNKIVSLPENNAEDPGYYSDPEDASQILGIDESEIVKGISTANKII